MNINRSSFYKWLRRRDNPSIREINRMEACKTFEYYHNLFPSHGYRWLNAYIRIMLGVVYSDNYSHKICKFLNIKSEAKHFKRRYKKYHRELKNFPNYILAELNPLRPFQIVVSDMTAFWANKHYYELTLFMDLFNNEIVSYSLSNKKGNPDSYHSALKDLITKKEELFIDFKINSCDDIPKQIEEYIYFFNNQRPQAALKYLTPAQFKHLYYNKED